MLLPVIAALSRTRSGAAPGPGGDAEISVSLAASRTSGPAPLYVQFDAVGTTADIEGVSDTFRQLLYTFDYGETGLGNWPISGHSRNQDVGGPIAAHVFETPGTYTVRCTASRGELENWAETTITVTDPDTVYAGTDTIFVSPTSDFEDAPSGATTATSIPTITSGKRILLNRGESHGAVSIPHAVDDVIVCSGPGAGAEATVSSINVGGSSQPPNGNFPQRNAIHNLRCTGGVNQNIVAPHTLLHKITGVDSNLTVRMGGLMDYYADPSRYGTTMPWVRYICLSEISGTGPTNDFLMYGHLIQSAIIGCDWIRSQQHTARVWVSYKGFIAHNAIRGVATEDNIRHCLKLNGYGANAFVEGGTFADVSDWATRYVVISRNLFGDSTNNVQQTTAVGPQSPTLTEGLEDVIFENNRFIDGANTSSRINLAGRRFTCIGNVMDSDDSAVSHNVDTGKSPGLPGGGTGGSWDGPYYTSRT